MKSDIFGLDIGSTSIKAVWLNHEKETFSFLSALSCQAPIPGLQSESPFDHQEVAQAINKLITDAKIYTNKVSIALAENHIFTKVIDMPVLSDKELSSAIYWEAEEHIPAPIDTLSLAWSILKKPPQVNTSQRMQVLLVAAPLKLIKKYQSILELAGLSVVAIESEMLSIIRSLFRTPSSPTSIILNIGTLSTSIAIVQSGVINFNYSIPLGGMAMTRSIASAFGLDTKQAEEYKRTYGLSTKNLSGKVGVAIRPIFSNILIEIKKAIAYHNEKDKNNFPISQIVLVGGSANLPGVDVYLVENIGIETVVANPWKTLGISNIPSQLMKLGPEYAIATGLAIKEL